MCEVLQFVQSSAVHVRDEPVLNKQTEPSLNTDIDWESTKPRRFFFRGLIFRGIARGGGEWREIPGTGDQIFSPPFHPVRGKT